MSIKSRLDALERHKALTGMCDCPGQNPVILYGEEESAPERCPKCGRERLRFRIVYDEGVSGEPQV